MMIVTGALMLAFCIASLILERSGKLGLNHMIALGLGLEIAPLMVLGVLVWLYPRSL